MSRDPLINFLRARSRRSFSRLVKQTHRQILDAAYRVSGDRHLAEDVTQEVFLKLLTVRWDPDKIRSGIALLASTAVAAVLVAAGLDTWAAWPWLAPGEATEAIGSGRQAPAAAASKRRTDAPPSDAPALPRKIVVRLEGDGEGWPPAAVPVTVRGKEFETTLRSESAAPLEVLLAPGPTRSRRMVAPTGLGRSPR
jgi:hypothetical protein